MGRVEDELPLAAREEDADGEVGAEEGYGEDGGEGFENPAELDELDHLGGCGAGLGSELAERVVAGLQTGGGLGAGGLGVVGHGSFALCSASHGERFMEENDIGGVGAVVWGGGGSEVGRGDGG
jgi:hypothetical protein